ncbi:peroxisomal long-chain fatty acid import protein [Chloropicon primus]|uniref:Peroxisomal long-chain fatty acid import protein n=1 Tax=Chloropicon primus TaxID=1764295 RepID=A0A5B8MEB6_9CHLO|nr:peroxisomal long-chain fatty acid import protein [Chloropicon primus]UPQ98166.1 peroxisomal long-chain fatty acid import protein [Chloropicon primus]|mmetsp:Transcript_4548/g.13485  ORF Transcript_4548/g.13485 Transcript_4548/m.13485 type:complete len:707 (-) Transcript_4548:50-2170(-)|eukprot:QDZ18958.1 peroxisomal long-chain fatty acid import protein [Chloropicon primus]
MAGGTFTHFLLQRLQKELKVDKLSRKQKGLVLSVLVLGVGSGSLAVKRVVKRVRKEQKEIWTVVTQSSGKGGGAKEGAKGSGKGKKRVAVDGVFLERLGKILKVCVPSFFSKEMLLVLTQGGLLVTRSLLTDLIAEQEGACGSALINGRTDSFLVHMMKFSLVAVPASVVNSGLKMFQKFIEVRFRERLGVYLHGKYLKDRCYYQASTQVDLPNIDQRLTEDVENFANSISELYNHTLKPFLDVVLFTRSLSRVMGYKTQGMLYSYFFVVALTLKSISPPLSLMHAQESGLSGNLRGAHHRLVSKTEEVAYNDPPAAMTEQLLLNKHLRSLLRYSSMTSVQKFLQQIADQYLVKYGASVVALSVYAIGTLGWAKEVSGITADGTSTRAKDYIRSMRLLQNTSKSVGDLILVYKRIAKLAGHTSRVAELLEEIDKMQDPKSREVNFYGAKGMPEVCLEPNRVAQVKILKPREPQTMVFDGVTICAPDGQVLVKDLSMQLGDKKDSMLITGPNGSGKSSLVRVIAGLWPLAKGTIARPSNDKMFFLSQRPYLVTGSLRDQLLYPHPSQKLISSSSRHDAAIARSASKNRPFLRDRDLKDALGKVELDYLLERYSLDTIVNWEETLSGGEKQRVAMARLLCHKPKFAVLDECTSAVSADGEEKLYQILVDSGISFLSIAHRPGVRKYHARRLEFDGSLQGAGWKVSNDL